MPGRWQREERHVGTPADPAVKHLDGIPWHDRPIPSACHRRCYAQTLEYWWFSYEPEARQKWPDAGIQICPCGAVRDSARPELGWIGRNTRRTRRAVARRADLTQTLAAIPEPRVGDVAACPTRPSRLAGSR